MMQEEDCLDFSPTSDNMAGVDVSFGDVDCNVSTLLMAASASNLDASDKSEDGRKGFIDNKEVTVVGNAPSVTEEALDSRNKKEESKGESKEDRDGLTLADERTGESKIGYDNSSRVKELFSHSDDGETFGAIETSPATFSTASVLFASGDTAGSPGLFSGDDSANSFSNLISNNVNKSLNNQENQKQSEKNLIDPLNNSFQSMGIAGAKTGNYPSPTVPPQFPSYSQSSMIEPSQVILGTQSSVESPPISNKPVPMGAGGLEPSSTILGSSQNMGQSQAYHGSQNQVYPASQNQVPMLYNPANQQQKHGLENPSIDSLNAVDNFKPQNGANVGNSYMYTSPIASVITGYKPSQGSQMPQKQAGTRLHQSHVPKQSAMPAGELFVPDLYGHSTVQPSNQVNIFTPSAEMTFDPQSVPQNVPQNFPQMGYGVQNLSNSNHDAQNYHASPNVPPYNFQEYQQFANDPNFHPGNSQDPGFWEWVKNQDWSEGAQKLGKQLLQKTKDAADSVITTLDPGMEEHLSPSIHLAIASHDSKVLQAVRQGFKHTFGHTAAKGHFIQHSLPKLPIGFDFGSQAVTEQLDVISTIDFKFSQPYIHVALQPFLTELRRGSWSCMFCMAVRDCSRRIQLQAFSQPISIPSACISIAYSRASQGNGNCGFDVSIDELVRLFKPYAGDEDWCSTLNGIRLETVISLTAQGLAADYKRELESSSLTQNDSFLVLPS